MVMKNDTFICLGDVGEAKYVKEIKAKKKILIHDHNCVEPYKEGCKHINLAANVCGYTPINLGKIIKEGVVSDIRSIHRMTIDGATIKKRIKEESELLQ